ncbi:hypothetical protein CJU94_02075 [Paraburkholderia aromaticivorans]|uniref:DUF6566 domain-containing protein n=2 Tax=Paraburkholderia aromaticivorans TaxID=2026199 RepID=A0A248VP01_9BURK|nr:hypothetical protein CJU94_02075 [Paraburkholderia aromaticivorans]
MPACTVSYGEFEIVVRPETNERGAWVASVSVSRGTGTPVYDRPMTIQPEWLTEEEAIRDGVEWGSRFVDHELNAQPPHSDVAERSRAEHWFRDVEESRGAKPGT